MRVEVKTYKDAINDANGILIQYYREGVEEVIQQELAKIIKEEVIKAVRHDRVFRLKIKEALELAINTLPMDILIQAIKETVSNELAVVSKEIKQALETNHDDYKSKTQLELFTTHLTSNEKGSN